MKAFERRGILRTWHLFDIARWPQPDGTVWVANRLGRPVIVPLAEWQQVEENLRPFAARVKLAALIGVLLVVSVVAGLVLSRFELLLGSLGLLTAFVFAWYRAIYARDRELYRYLNNADFEKVTLRWSDPERKGWEKAQRAGFTRWAVFYAITLLQLMSSVVQDAGDTPTLPPLFWVCLLILALGIHGYWRFKNRSLAD